MFYGLGYGYKISLEFHDWPVAQYLKKTLIFMVNTMHYSIFMWFDSQIQICNSFEEKIRLQVTLKDPIRKSCM